ncbi:MAG: phosphatase [Lachnospiraceae bacterium]|nr:phosphatase [Lachnospiraceae bacterium]MDD3795329.1 phosphatase [Lachnospiraceae bacterium]
MKIVADTHTHTLASAHAYSTVAELAEAAAKKHLELLAVTDHAPVLPDSPHKLHFMNYHVLPKEMYGVELLYGAELSILDQNGHVDLEEEILKRQDICIASYHTMCTPAGTMEENTQAYLSVMENPYVNVIGHPDDGYVPVDFERLVKRAKEKKVLLEVNNSSLKAAFYRLNTRENIRKMLDLCKRYEVPVSLGSDAHYSGAVGGFEEAKEVLREAEFPQELIANLDAKRLKELLALRRRN